MIVIVTNREVNEGVTDHTAFGERPNQAGLDELRIATAVCKNKKWKVDLLDENPADIAAGKPPSRQLFMQILNGIKDGSITGNWLVFVHGFNQSFEDNLIKCKAIEDIYGYNVLAFSWPSNQGGFKLNEYKKARAAARGCTNAFDRMMEKLGEYLAFRPFQKDCVIRLSLMSYSLGNYVVENFVRAPIFAGETKIFDSVILTQADVDVETHASWVQRMACTKRVFVTINEDDSVLKWSDVVNPPRLGNTAKYLTGEEVVYFDFTNGKGVGSTHGIFYKTVKKNAVVKKIFAEAMAGGRPERIAGVVYNELTNAYELAVES